MALWLLAIEGLIGAFDTLYYHGWRAQLPGRGALVAPELKLHAARDFFYAVLFATLPWVAWHGAWVLGAGRRVRRGDCPDVTGLRCEDEGAQRWETSIRENAWHMRSWASCTGAMIASLVPVLLSWWPLPSALVMASVDVPDLLRWGLMTMALGVFASDLRDLYAAYELAHGGWPWR